jgi:UrcA family protein
METKTFLLAAALVAAMSQSPASAEDFKFRYKSHELETAGGRADMMARLDRSIERHCGAGSERSLGARRMASECRQILKAEVMSKFDDVTIASLNR